MALVLEGAGLPPSCFYRANGSGARASALPPWLLPGVSGHQLLLNVVNAGNCR